MKDALRMLVIGDSHYAGNTEDPLLDRQVQYGLEIESDKNGGITLMPEDSSGLDIIIGAVHVLPDELLSAPSDKLHSAFMETPESLIKHGLAVLAHPFRFFHRGKMPAPQHLYRPMAQMLREYAVAEGMSFHINRPDRSLYVLP